MSLISNGPFIKTLFISAGRHVSFKMSGANRELKVSQVSRIWQL